MRRIFTPLPYFLPAEPEPFVKLFRQHGVTRLVKKGEFLQRGGEAQKLFFLEEGLCAYYAAEALDHRPMVISVILPGRVMGDMTASIRTRCNVYTKALRDSRVLAIPPEVLARAIEVDSDLAAIEIRSIILKEESLIEGIAANALRPPAERVVIYAKALCRSFDVKPDADGWNRLPVAIPAETIGEVVNLNRVSVARLLSHWMDGGHVLREGRTLYFQQRLFDAVDDWLENRVPKVALP